MAHHYDDGPNYEEKEEVTKVEPKKLKTKNAFFEVIEDCEDIFKEKSKSYGTSWRVFRLSSIIDQIYIKIRRIREVEIQKENKVGEDTTIDYMSIINYSLIGLIQLELGPSSEADDIKLDAVYELYEKYYIKAWELLEKKNHDYGEAWRDMYVESFTDLMLVKINRLKEIYESGSKDINSITDNYFDMINYSIFALIKRENG